MSQALQVDQNLTTILDRAADRFGDREAVCFENHAFGFSTLRDRAYRLAAGLAAMGVSRGDRVAVLLHNGLEWVEVFFALAARGATCVPVNVLLRPHEVAHILEDSDARALVLDAAGARIASELDALPDIIIGVEGAGMELGASRYEDLFSSSSRFLERGPGTSDPFVFYYSSGTTGAPKAVIHTHNNVLWNSFHQIPDLGITASDTYLVVPSLSWAAGFHDVMIAALWVGGRSVIMPTGGITLDRIVSTAKASRATAVLLVPTLLKQLLDDPVAQHGMRETSLRFVLTGAEPVPLPVIESFIDLFPATSLLQGYGLSEFPTIATLLREEEAIERAGWAGRPNSITRLAVLTDAGDITDEGEGEILLRSPASMLGYWNRPDQTAETLADGWLHTGDVGVVDDEGFLRISGRKKEMIISGGLNVYPSEVEAVLYAYDRVREAAVIGIPDRQWGEVPVAVVVPDGQFNVDEFLAFCNKRLAAYKTPKQVFIHEDPLPRTTSGKVLKRSLEPWVEKAAPSRSGAQT